jgi:demethylmenaquinone methyltransferase / 2-methoxy-6-polyprenyl-1,4-benzoquinol methylase
MTDKDTTDFGFQRIPASEKAGKVRRIFDSVANKYDVMNDVMSFGIHRIWKRVAAELGNFREGQRVLDLAAGTGDMTRLLAHKVGPGGRVLAADINAAMLQAGRDRCTDKGLAGNIAFIQADAERLPFPDDTFDGVVMAFGLRNVTHKDNALCAIYRVLKPGGQALLLEFSKPSRYIQPLYDAYSYTALPFMGKVIAGDADSYRYLAESIRTHPDQRTLQAMLERAGFEHCDFLNMSTGIVALHRGYKL